MFQGSDKPASIKKITDERGKVTPMIDTNALSLINELVKFKNELINDRGQLSYVLKSHKKPEIFDKILRTLLDYPTFALKAKVFEALQQNPKHSLAFALNLSNLLNKVFAQLQPTTTLTNVKV